AGLLALAGVLGVGEGHLLHRKALRVKSADFAKSGSLFQSFPSLLWRSRPDFHGPLYQWQGHRWHQDV
ncbi:hypothetical protein LJG08_07720, partial [Pseudomonas aeruginosa]|uniref:hypothetical protein n=1 Tax=Pseudomonas aeruginosa TaxID=287 RepID=UPI001D0A4FDD